jgi:hypothetical protein
MKLHVKPPSELSFLPIRQSDILCCNSTDEKSLAKSEREPAQSNFGFPLTFLFLLLSHKNWAKS